MGDMVKAAVIRQAGKIAIERFPRPQVGPDDMLVRVLRAGICGTDVEIYKGLLTEFKLPLVMGHEIVGEVVEAGENVEAVRGLRVGDRVVMEGSMSCGSCKHCLSGNKRHCKTAGSYGLRKSCQDPPHLWGGYAELLYVPMGAKAHRVPPQVSLDAAVLITSVIANGIQWVSRIGECKLGDIVVVQGAGPQAVSCCIAAKSSGAKTVIVTGLPRDRQRLKLAQKFGADFALVSDECDVLQEVDRLTDGQMADIVVDVTGSPKSPQLSVDLVREKGTVVHASQMGTTVATPLFLDTMVRKEVKLIGARSKGDEAIRVAFDMAERGTYPFSDMITHRFTLDEIGKAFAGFDSADRPFKAVIQPNPD